MTLAVGSAAMAHAPAAAALALIGSAIVVHWARRRRPSLGAWRVLGLALVALLVWTPEPDVLAQRVEAGVALALIGLAVWSAAAHARQARRLARRLQVQADAMDDRHLLSLLPREAAELARRWQAGEDRHGRELGAVMHLAVMHASLAQGDTTR